MSAIKRIQSFIVGRGNAVEFILRHRNGVEADRAKGSVTNARLRIVSSDGTVYRTFSPWRARHINHANTYDQIATTDGILLRTVATDASLDARGDGDNGPLGLHHDVEALAEISQDEEPQEEDIFAEPDADPAELFRYRLYHGLSPIEYVGFMRQALQHDFARFEGLRAAWPAIAGRAAREAVKNHIRFQHGLRWASKTMPCLYKEAGLAEAIDQGARTAMDHVIPVSEMADAVFAQADPERRLATLIRAWLCPVAHITQTSHDHLTRGRHPNHLSPFLRYFDSGIDALDWRGRAVAEQTLDVHFATLAQIPWVQPIIEDYIAPYDWAGLHIIGPAG